MRDTEITRFDSADFLNNAEAIGGYLDAYLEDSTLDELREALATVLRSDGVADLERRGAVSRSAITRALGDGNPSYQTIRATLEAMGLRLRVVWAECPPA